MTCLEGTLASILECIERAREARDALALAKLLQRKDAICAALAAPEQSWSQPHEGAPVSAAWDAAQREIPLVA